MSIISLPLTSWRMGRIIQYMANSTFEPLTGGNKLKTISWKESRQIQNPHDVDARMLYDTENAQVVHIVLKPGEKLRKHITPVDVIFYVLEGKGIVEIGEEREEVGTDTLIDSPANAPHCWYNENTENLRFLVIKVPKPKENTRLL